MIISILVGAIAEIISLIRGLKRRKIDSLVFSMIAVPTILLFDIDWIVGIISTLFSAIPAAIIIYLFLEKDGEKSEEKKKE